MNNIEKLAERDDDTKMLGNVSTDELEVMSKTHPRSALTIAYSEGLITGIKRAKALQQSSEPVWVLSRDNKGRTTNFISGFPTKFDISKLPDGTELFITPPATVPLEKYNKLLDALKESYMHMPYSSKRAEVEELIAEAEGKEG